MLNGYSSNAIMTKARAMYGKRLTAADFQELARKRTVGEIASYLKSQTYYAGELRNIEEHMIHRGQLELLLRRSLFDRYSRLCAYQYEKDDGFYKYLIMFQEKRLIMSAIRLLNSGSPQDLILEVHNYLQQHATFDLFALASVKSFDDLLEVLKGTVYYAGLKGLGPDEGSMIDYNACEYALNTAYYSRVLHLIERHAGIPKKAQAQLRGIFLQRVELMNLSIIYRLKRFYHTEAQQIKKQLLPFRYKLNDRQFEELLNARSEQEVLELIGKTTYGKYLVQQDFKQIEAFMANAQYQMTKKLIHFSEYSPVVIAAFMWQLQIEVENIVSIIEGVRYNLSPSEIEAQLVG
ncbi:V0D/AC39 family V-type ATPase subunit [Candidatus Soleaferrea massiliensis]|uniref:V0D/AC39 family V-type ATPase subunit n=1 Tax=Candidatus Soleaferrea massiliensis TaxID=1470354 RepID=UPI00058E3F82|nr:V-type ATPase subunit [Candidatus Soleaferrea massiliensis]